MLPLSLSAPQRADFAANGFVVIDQLIGAADIAALRDRFDRLFAGEFETGVEPDEVNWQFDGGDPTLTRQICNGWKADTVIAATVLRSDIGRALAELAGWPGARVIQDNLLWKPPSARSVGFHRDNAYLGWYQPQEMMTCWIALDDTDSAGGTVEYAARSHRWPPVRDGESTFHAPQDHRAALDDAAGMVGETVESVPVVVPAGGGSLHHGWTWHGSAPNATNNDRRALAIHLASSVATFNRAGFDQGTGPVYSRYAAADHDRMATDAFPIVWSADLSEP